MFGHLQDTHILKKKKTHNQSPYIYVYVLIDLVTYRKYDQIAIVTLYIEWK